MPFLFAFVAIPSAHACVSLKLENKSDIEIRAVWSAAGCFGVDGKSQIAFKCTGHDVPAGTSRSHNFDFGKSAQAINLYYDGIDRAEGMKVQVSFSYDYGKNKYVKTWGLSHFPDTPHGCHHHYTVTYTSDDVVADSETKFRNSLKENKHHRW